MSDQFKLSKTYEPQQIESSIFGRWLAAGAFHAVPDGRPTYVIMMPLPNVTGALHMGHAMDNVMQDLLIRWHRMRGENTLWMPGTDHAGIATQAVVEKRLRELEGKTRHDLGREGLVARIFEWKDQFQARIVQQQQRMGCSADWQRQRFTMDPVCTRAVRHTFLRMFQDGLILRGKRLVNWDPFLQTSISDDEVVHQTVHGHFYHLRYPVIEPEPGEPAFVEVATTRPETMLGDTAVAVHPDPAAALAEALRALGEAIVRAPKKERPALEGERDALLAREREVLPLLVCLRDMAQKGRMVRLPLLDRPIPLILDAWAKPQLGTGSVKITPAHDPNDYEVWKRHRARFAIINLLNPDGTLNKNAGPYAGLDRFEARKRVVQDLRAQELLGEVLDREIEVGHSDRSKVPIEPYLSDQWFVNMGDVEGGVRMGRGTPREHVRAGLVQAAIDLVHEGRVRFHPERFAKTYLDWLSEKRDWPISRQLWWGHRIPVWSRRAPREEAVLLVAEVFLKVLAPLGPGRACVRLVRPESASLLVEAPDRIPELQEGEWLLDVCLREDDPAAVAALASLGFEQDPDVLDTWFSSALWPHSTLGWPDPATAEVGAGAPLGALNGQLDCLETYYPGSCLVTARDIITLWVARMVMCGMYNLGDVPFSDVFIHANILDGKGERMSKSKGNGIDPVDIIEAYGADAMRYVLADMQTGNQDIRLPVTVICPRCSEKHDLTKLKHGQSIFTYLCGSCRGELDVLGTMPGVPAAKLLSDRFLDGSKFCNKLWNTARFALGHVSGTAVWAGPLGLEDLEDEDRWILAALNQAIRAVTQSLEDYNPSAAIGAARDFMWGELCDWYLELVKPRLAEGASDTAQIARRVLAHCLDQTLRLLHPFVPFATEYLFQELQAAVPARGIPGLWPEEGASPLLLEARWPRPVPALDDEALLQKFEDQQSATSATREVRAARGVPPGQTIRATARPHPERAADFKAQKHIVERMGNLVFEAIDPEAAQPPASCAVTTSVGQIFLHDLVDPAAERERLGRELQKVLKEIVVCGNKLQNPSFVEKAPPEVVAEQRERLAKYEEQKAAIEGALRAL